LSVRAVHLFVLCGLVGLAALVFVASRRDASRTWSDSVLFTYLPPNATFVLTADVEALRRSDLGALVPGGERELPGVGKLSSVCGFDPTAEVRALAVALVASPQPDAADELGVIAGGDFRAQTMADCARKVIVTRGGRPSERRLGGFTLLSGVGQGVLAMREHGPVLLGDESVLRGMIRGAEARTSVAGASKVHAKLRQALGAAPLVATWQPSPVRTTETDTLREELGPLSYARGVAVALRVTPTARLDVLVSCESFEQCGELAASIHRAGRRLLADLVPASWGSRDVEVTVANHEVRLRIPMAPRDLGALAAALAQRL
jgi:hypothetical protein